jgi:hypothetical protein
MDHNITVSLNDNNGGTFTFLDCTQERRELIVVFEN